MFITVTHFGSGRPLRVAIAAIAYLDIGPEDSSALRLIGGETLRVIETPAEIEAACSARRISAIEVTEEWLATLPEPVQHIDPEKEKLALAASEASGLISSEGASGERVSAAIEQRRKRR